MTHRRPQFLLASQSPRRRKILSLLSIPFKAVKPIGVDETPGMGESPRHLVERLALLKASTIALKHPRSLVLGADTVVVKNKKIYGKPKDRREARAMLLSLEGSGHAVYTGVALVWKLKRVALSHVEVTRVSFRRLSSKEREAYLATAEPYDKAGGYAIQGTAFRWIKKWEGDYFNVMGLPIQWIVQQLSRLKI